MDWTSPLPWLFGLGVVVGAVLFVGSVLLLLTIINNRQPPDDDDERREYCRRPRLYRP